MIGKPVALPLSLGLAGLLAACAGTQKVGPVGTTPLFATVDRVQGGILGVRAGLRVAQDDGGGQVTVSDLASTGSAVALGNGLALTSLHVVALDSGDGQVHVSSHVAVQTAGGKLVPAVVEGAWADCGLALLRFDEAQAGATPVQLSAAGDEHVPLIAVGNEGGRLSAEAFSAEQIEAGGDVLRLSGGIGPHQLGAALFGADGQVRAIVVDATPDGPGVAIPAAVLTRLLKSRPPAAEPQATRLPPNVL